MLTYADVCWQNEEATTTHAVLFSLIEKKKQEPVWYKLKNGAQRMQRNPKMFLRKDNLRIRRMEEAKKEA